MTTDHLTLRLPRHRLEELLQALLSLNGYIRVVNEQPVQTPFKLTGKTRSKIADNIIALRPNAVVLSEKREALIQNITGGKTRFDPEEHPDWDDEFRQAFKPFRDEVVEIHHLHRLTMDELLNEDRNPIQPHALAVIKEHLITNTESEE